MTNHDTWFAAEDLTLPNGIKVHEGAVYWTNQREIRKTVVASNGTAGETSVIVDEMTFFDDLSVRSAGILAADLSAGALAAFDLTGAPIARTPEKLLDTPSSVLPALGRLGFAKTDILVTEKNANRLGVVHQCDPERRRWSR